MEIAADVPAAMLKAARGVVHNWLKPEEALDLYNTMKNEN